MLKNVYEGLNAWKGIWKLKCSKVYMMYECIYCVSSQLCEFILSHTDRDALAASLISSGTMLWTIVSSADISFNFLWIQSTTPDRLFWVKNQFWRFQTNFDVFKPILMFSNHFWCFRTNFDVDQIIWSCSSTISCFYPLCWVSQW